MRAKVAILVLLAGICGFAQQGSKVREDALTGCVDERTRGYVLLDPADRREVADLDPVAFDKENLAKYLGQKVSVRGKVTREGDRTVVKIQSIRKISEVCSASSEDDAPEQK